jgi:hypothetical protein
MVFVGRAAGRGAFKGAALVGAFAIIVAAWWWDASLLTAAADANLQLIKIVTSKLPFDWGSKIESGLRIFGADRALLLIGAEPHLPFVQTDVRLALARRGANRPLQQSSSRGW